MRGAATREASRRREAIVVALACAAQFLVGADGLSVAIALPALQSDLAVAPIDAQWVLSAYGLAFGGTLLLAGRLGDLYGRRRMLVWGLAVFALGGVVAGVAPGLPALVAARAVQGLGAAAAVPAALALIGSLIPPGPGRTRALSLLAAMASVGIMTGLLVGGVVTEVLGWRWVFLVIAPGAAVAAAAAQRMLPEVGAQDGAAGLDVGGAVLVTGALTAIVFGVTRVEHDGLGAPLTLLPLAAGLLLLAAFVAWERRSPAPLVPGGVLAIRSLRTATVAVGVNSIAFTSVVYVGTLYLQGPLELGPIAAGLALLPLDAVAFAVPLIAAGRIARRSPRALLTASFALTALALLWLARAPVPATYAIDVLPPLVALGVSLPVAFVVLTQEAVADVAGDDKGLASGIFETANHLFGGAVGVALYATAIAAAAPATDGAGGYRAAFLVAVLLSVLGVGAGLAARSRAPA